MTGQDVRLGRSPRIKRQTRPDPESASRVTICLAALRASPPLIVAVSDLKLTDDSDYGTEVGILKSFQLDLHGRWHAMFADAHSAFVPIWRHTAAALSLQQQPITNPEYLRHVMEGAFAIEIERKIQQEILGPFALTRERFTKEGRQILGDDLFAAQVQKMQDVTLPVQLLVFGLADQLPTLYAVGGRGDFHDHSFAGYFAIGDGCHRALDVLNDDPGFRLNTRPLEEVVYRLCEAKFASESANTVGGATFMTIHEPNSNRVFGYDAIRELRKIWDARRREPPPSEAIEVIQRGLGTSKPLFE